MSSNGAMWSVGMGEFMRFSTLGDYQARELLELYSTRFQSGGHFDTQTTRHAAFEDLVITACIDSINIFKLML